MWQTVHFSNTTGAFYKLVKDIYYICKLIKSITDQILINVLTEKFEN